MKSIKLLLLVALSLSVIMGVATISAFAAEDIEPYVLPISSINVETNTESVSYGLQVIAQSKGMIMTGIKGNALSFSAERFACAMNLSKIDSITVTKLPSTACGVLYIGSEGVSVGQKIKASDIALMTYEEVSGSYGRSTAFEVMINDNGYTVTCNINMIDGINYSPTLTIAPAISFECETYRDVKACGVLSAYDPEGDALVYEIVDFPENGRVYLDDERLGTYTYVPNSSYTGEDSFRYVVFDEYGNYSESGEVKVKVSTPAVSAVYSDLLNDGLYSHAISVTESGLMNGVQVGDYYYFEADREVSRAEYVITAMKAIGIKNVPDVNKTVFADDDSINPEMKGYVALAYSKGYISGKAVDGKLYFDPDEKIKISEAAVILSNMIGYASPKVTPVFADAGEIPTWSEKAIKSLHTLGILELPDMKVSASSYVTRGEMAKLLNKTMSVIN